jgi:putative endonuclease
MLGAKKLCHLLRVNYSVNWRKGGLMEGAWVYILECSDKSYYVGSTTNLEQRMFDHITGRFGGYTSSRLPVRLLWSHGFSDIRDAFAFERRIKKWNRAKKEALMRGDFDLLHLLSRSKPMKKKLGIK